jgi:hypothetical protein
LTNRAWAGDDPRAGNRRVGSRLARIADGKLQVLVVLTARRLKPGTFEQWRRAWEPKEWPEQFSRASFCAIATVTIGTFLTNRRWTFVDRS